MATQTIAKVTMPDDDALFAAVAQGDLSKLTTQQKLAYYNRRCSDLGLNPLNQPFQWLMLNGKLTLYANRQCSEELRKINGVSFHKLDKQKIDDLYVVTAYARDKTGREDCATGAVNLAGLKGEAAANAMMKAETKAKRRCTLSICGLGTLDETEVETIPTARTLQLAAGDYEQKFQHVIDKAEGKQDSPATPPPPQPPETGGDSGQVAPESQLVPEYEEAERYTSKLVKIKPVSSGAKLEFVGNDNKPWHAWVKSPKWMQFLTDQGAKAGCMIDLTVCPRGDEYEVTVIWSVTPGETPLEKQLAESVKQVEAKKVDPTTNLEKAPF